jgi:nitroreductase
MACAAPSAGDLQSYRIFGARSGERQALVHVAHEQTFIAEAPVCLVFCADPARSATAFGERGAKLYALQDTTIAAAYAQLAIVAAGMGSTWVGYFEEDQVRVRYPETGTGTDAVSAAQPGLSGGTAGTQLAPAAG